MTYQDAINYLYAKAPMFQHIGQGAYKEGLFNTIALDNHFGNPHRQFKTIHIAGTNGKGSCSHFIASILQEAGYKVGLYTSPHLLDFRERIRVDGKMIPQNYVTKFIKEEKSFFEPLNPSFFEITTALAFKYFCDSKIDVAVIEVGLGGRLDCTNIITPEVAVITNISYDHVGLLGHSLRKIATEKAGIMKPGVATVIGEYNPTTRRVFDETAEKVCCPLVYAQDNKMLKYSRLQPNGHILFRTNQYGIIDCALGGIYQKKNVNTVLNAVDIIREKFPRIDDLAILQGFANVVENTGIMGRWQQISKCPDVFCDTGHNVGGIRYVTRQLSIKRFKQLRIVIGMVNDKDVSGVLRLLPKQAEYYFCKASVPRALNPDNLRNMAKSQGLNGLSFNSVQQAYTKAMEEADKEDLIFVGGSTFVVADLLACTK